MGLWYFHVIKLCFYLQFAQRSNIFGTGGCNYPPRHRFTFSLPGPSRLLRPLHPGLPLLRVPQPMQHGAGAGVLRRLQLGGLLLLLRRRPGRRLQLPLRHGLWHHGRLLRVFWLPGDLHGVLWHLLPHIKGPHTHYSCSPPVVIDSWEVQDPPPSVMNFKEPQTNSEGPQYKDIQMVQHGGFIDSRDIGNIFYNRYPVSKLVFMKAI